MATYIELNNKTIRRERNAFGGSKAWKQHDYDNGSHDRQLALARMEEQLAAEALAECINGRPQVSASWQQHRGPARARSHNPRGRRADNRRYSDLPVLVERVESPTRQVERPPVPVSIKGVVVKPAESQPPRRLKVFIDEGGTMRAVRLS